MVETALTPDFRIIDISQPIAEKNACFPGDTPFSRQVTVTYEQSKVINLTSLTMSPHVGTHIDAPVHVRGTMSDMKEMVGVLPLSPFIGECAVIDIAPWKEAIKPEQIENKIKGRALPPRILFRTCHHIRYDVFEEEYAYFSVELVDYLAEKGVVLFGIDAPSADHIRAKELKAHHRLLKREMYWLENLDLTAAPEGDYFLVALPLKFMELEASPIRAVLLEGRK